MDRQICRRRSFMKYMLVNKKSSQGLNELINKFSKGLEKSVIKEQCSMES